METTDTTVSIYSFLDWLHTNRKKIGAGAIAVAVVALVVALSVWKKGQNQADANNLLFSVPSLLALSPRQAPANPEAFLNIAHEYPGTSAGEQAQLLAAERLFLDGQYAEADHEFSKFVAEHPDSPLRPQAQVGVAASLEAEGKATEAMQKYRDVVAMYATDPNIASPAKLTLARLNEEQNKPEQALTYYEDLARDTNPYDPWAAEARERRELLLAKHPELNKPATPAPTSGLGVQQPGFSMPAQPSQPVAAPSTGPAKSPAGAAKPPTGAASPGSPNFLSIPRQATNGPGKAKP
jgi:predicted negative regulator of RcsB-dependent stress response